MEKFIIGIDEAGRGPLAGDVCVGVVLLPKNFKTFFKKNNAPKKLADSKKLSEKQRNEWFLWMKKNKIIFSYVFLSPGVIDRINISNACNLSAKKGLIKVFKKLKGANVDTKKIAEILKKGEVLIIADGGIKVRELLNLKNFKSLPKADENFPAVSLASIVAKVSRDKKMVNSSKKYPHYGFDIHKGYGTKKHISAIKKYGPSKIHRKTFIKNIIK